MKNGSFKKRFIALAAMAAMSGNLYAGLMGDMIRLSYVHYDEFGNIVSGSTVYPIVGSNYEHAITVGADQIVIDVNGNGFEILATSASINYSLYDKFQFAFAFLDFGYAVTDLIITTGLSGYSELSRTATTYQFSLSGLSKETIGEGVFFSAFFDGEPPPANPEDTVARDAAATAQASADAAQLSADQALANAATAQTTADGAATAAGTAQATADAATGAAATAQATADSATTAAAAAQTTADQALTAAGTAQATADGAATAAAAAQTTANTALTAAGTAQAKADAAQADATAALTGSANDATARAAALAAQTTATSATGAATLAGAAAAAAQADATAALSGAAYDRVARDRIASAETRLDGQDAKLSAHQAALMDHESRIAYLEAAPAGTVDSVARSSIKDLDKRIASFERRAMQAVASSMASNAALPAGVGIAPGETLMGIGVASYGGQAAVAVGMAKQIKDVQYRGMLVRGSVVIAGGKPKLTASLGWNF